jgi:hypothetical protein
MYKPLETLARDEAANMWVDTNVPGMVAAQLRAWGRMQIEKYDADDRAEIGVLLTKPGLMQTGPEATPVRGYVYGLIFTREDEPQVCQRAILRINNEHEIVEFVPVDHVETLH